MDKTTKLWGSQIQKCKWFERVGTGDLPGVVRANSWKDVEKHLASKSWDDMSLAALNEMHRAVHDTGRPRSEWKEGFDEQFDVVDELLDDTMAPVIKKNKLPKNIQDIFRRHVMCLLSSLRFFGADYQSHDRHIVEYYLDGYCPCGYQGKYPKGKLIVY